MCCWVQGLRANWTGLLLAMQRAKNETENQILIRDSKGLSEDQIKEYRQSFDHFDRVSYSPYFTLNLPSTPALLAKLFIKLPTKSLITATHVISLPPSCRTILGSWIRTNTEPASSVSDTNLAPIQ